MKKILGSKGAVLAALLLLGMAAAMAGCGGADKETDFAVTPVEGGKSVEISGYKGEKLDVKIPARIQNKPVTAIGENAFNDKKLTGVTIPKSVTVIGSGAFARNPLTGITLPGGLKEIGNNAFAYCENLTGISIPASVTSIGSRAFADCTGLTGITLPAGVTSIGQQAFQNCTGLTGITLPAGVTSIGRSAFSGCTGLNSITVDEKNPAYASEGGIVYNKAKTEIVAVPQGISGTVTLPASVTSIGDSVFSDCIGITGVTIPASVTSIGYRAFSACIGITEITLPAGITKIGNEAFYYWKGAQAINVQGKATQAAADAAWGYTVTRSFTATYVEGWRAGCNAVINYQGK